MQIVNQTTDGDFSLHKQATSTNSSSLMTTERVRSLSNSTVVSTSAVSSGTLFLGSERVRARVIFFFDVARMSRD
jgi:hypothetical protein